MLVLNHHHMLHSANVLEDFPHFVPWSDRREFAAFDHILWIKHVGSGIWWPWLVDGNEATFLSRIDKGIDTLTDAERQRGVEMGLLVDHQTLIDDPVLFLSKLTKCRADIEELGYCLLPSVTFPTYYYTVDYFVRLTESTFEFDNQVKRRRSKHNAVLMRAVHQQLAALVQSVADEQLKPSYCYLSVYPQGSELVRHTDRPQCRWNASITFARTSKDCWPIYVEGPRGVQAISAELGEVVVYRGTDVPHWRKPLPEGTATVCFFHFVNQQYQGVLN